MTKPKPITRQDIINKVISQVKDVKAYKVRKIANIAFNTLGELIVEGYHISLNKVGTFKHSYRESGVARVVKGVPSSERQLVKKPVRRTSFTPAFRSKGVKPVHDTQTYNTQPKEIYGKN